MSSLSGKVAKIRITASAASSSTGEACTRSTGTTGNGYVQINSTARRHWNRNNSTAFTLYLNSTAVGSTEFDINFVLGRFEWRDGDPSTGTYTADVEYHTSSFLAKANSWTVDTDVDMLEDTSFTTSTADAQWRTYVPSLSGWTASLSRFVSTGGSTAPEFFDRLNTADDVVVELWQDSTDRNKLEGYAYVSADSFSDEIGGLAEETVDLQGDQVLYHSTR